MHRELGLLDGSQYERLQDLAQKLQRTIPETDLIIFLCPEKRILEKRVTQSGHPSFIVENLGRQLSLYTEWLATRKEEVLRVDNSTCNLQTVEKLLSEHPPC